MIIGAADALVLAAPQDSDESIGNETMMACRRGKNLFSAVNGELTEENLREVAGMLEALYMDRVSLAFVAGQKDGDPVVLTAFAGPAGQGRKEIRVAAPFGDEGALVAFAPSGDATGLDALVESLIAAVNLDDSARRAYMPGDVKLELTADDVEHLSVNDDFGPEVEWFNANLFMASHQKGAAYISIDNTQDGGTVASLKEALKVYFDHQGDEREETVNKIYVTYGGNVVSAVFDNDLEKSRVVITGDGIGEETGDFTVTWAKRADRPSVAKFIAWGLGASS